MDEYDLPTNRIGYAIISVFPEDINDNQPQFDSDSLTGTVEENMETGASALLIIIIIKVW